MGLPGVPVIPLCMGLPGVPRRAFSFCFQAAVICHTNKEEKVRCSFLNKWLKEGNV